MFPRLLKAPNRCADETGSSSRNPQVFVENKNVMFLQLPEILEKRRPNARASALRKSRNGGKIPPWRRGCRSIETAPGNRALALN